MEPTTGSSTQQVLIGFSLNLLIDFAADGRIPPPGLTAKPSATDQTPVDEDRESIEVHAAAQRMACWHASAVANHQDVGIHMDHDVGLSCADRCTDSSSRRIKEGAICVAILGSRRLTPRR
jgi:hypothetical protein